jgi:hypothetical protein
MKRIFFELCLLRLTTPHLSQQTSFPEEPPNLFFFSEIPSFIPACFWRESRGKAWMSAPRLKPAGTSFAGMMIGYRTFMWRCA